MQLEQEPCAGVVGHLELGELRTGNPRRDLREMDHVFDGLGDQSLAAAPIARAPAERRVGPLAGSRTPPRRRRP